jgi:putative membrane protein
VSATEQVQTLTGLRHLRLAFGLLLGAGLFAFLVHRFRLTAVLAPLHTLGWSGLALLVVSQLALIILAAVAWRFLSASRAEDGFWRFIWGRLIRDSASQVLPFVQLGGIVAGVRAMTLSGFESGFAMASTMVDLAIEFVSELVYAALGLALLRSLRPEQPFFTALSGLLLMLAVLAGGFVIALARGTHWLAGFFEQFSAAFGHKLRVMAHAMHAIRARPRSLLAAFAVHLLAWVLTGLQTWLVLWLIGVRVSVSAALIIDSLAFSIRSLAFMVPGGLGVQEGAFVLIGGIFGVSPSAALALSLARRARDVAIGVPVLCGWQLAEGKRLWQRHSSLASQPRR